MYKQLTREQRYGIYLGIQEGKSPKAIARQINVHPSTVSREIARNKNRLGRYHWEVAHENRDIRRERFQVNHRVDAVLLQEALSLLVNEDWSPRQISGYLGFSGKRVSHGTIYKRVRADPSGELRGHCRHGMKYRHHVKRAHPTRATNIPNRVSIHERPKEADGKRFGDWEMDLIVGKGQKSAILTLCERSCNYLLMAKVPGGKKPAAVSRTVINMLLPYKRNVLSITTDNGTEFRLHQKIAKALDTTVYFADSYASWQKGAIENMNKLIRQYLPKGTDFNRINNEEIKRIQYKINRRPRQKLNFYSPKNVFFKLIS